VSTFIVTSHGRSGTKFLAELADRSREFSVYHEPTQQESFRLARARFAHADKEGLNYGEVNSRLRTFFMRIPVDAKMVIVRNPMDIFLSWANRKLRGKKFDQPVEEYLKYHDTQFKFLQSAINTGRLTDVIRFERMVCDAAYTEGILRWLGVSDVSVRPEDLERKVNANKTVIYHSLEDLPSEVVDAARARFAWFMEAHGYDA
jgi:hypothetical protein